MPGNRPLIIKKGEAHFGFATRALGMEYSPRNKEFDPNVIYSGPDSAKFYQRNSLEASHRRTIFPHKLKARKA